jgi:hypothetical protein
LGWILRQLNAQSERARQSDQLGGQVVALHRHVPTGDAEVQGNAFDPREITQPTELLGVRPQEFGGLFDLLRKLVEFRITG